MSRPHEHSTAGPVPSAQLLAQVADALAWPLLLINAEGSLLLANLAARRLLRQGAPLRLSTQRLVTASDPAQRTTFQRALQAAAAGNGSQLLHWRGPVGQARISASLSRLAGDAPGMPGDPTLLLALSPEGTRATDLRAFADQHALSPAETRVLERLALGESSAHAARALGVGAATVRSQTLSLRRKTGHASVAALLRTLAQLPPLVLPTAGLAAEDAGE